MKFSTTVLGALLCAGTALAAHSPHVLHKPKPKPKLERRAPGQAFKDRELQKRADKFLTDKTQAFWVNGTDFPETTFELPESYAGLLPISDDPSETRKLFFWFFPSTNVNCSEEVLIWLNGGPGCSSLSGLLTENGPFTWEDGTLAPVQNPYSWINLTNTVWVEQPVGVGYSQGTPNITNEVELGIEFRGFWKQFVTTFDMQNWATYVTGESYAGMYVPYIADSFIDANDTEYFNLKGIAINDPLIGDSTAQQMVPIMPFAEYWQTLFYLNDTFMEQMREHNEFCNYTSYWDTYFKFPPPAGPFPVLPDPFASPDATCDQFDNFLSAALEVNPCFNLYHISETCPHPYSDLGTINPGDYVPPGAEVYFNRTDVKERLHANVSTNWQQCTSTYVFINDTDTSLGPTQNGVLARVIEYTNNTLIGQGDLDMILCTNGTLLTIQNMTWGGVQGLQSYPSTPVYVPYHPEYNGGALAGAGYQGVWASERGLTFYTAHLSGHELPGYAPGVAYRAIEILLGRVSDFSSTDDFTTQTGDFTGNGTIYKK